MTKGYEDEFPDLAKEGLYAAVIPGDGNCLFSALSDQLYGVTDHQHMIRARTIDYMRENAPAFKAFLTVNAGGGVRRNPKRKNAGGFSTPLDASAASPEEVDRVFESHLKTMAKGGVYGDNMEIVAFSYAYDTNVKIYLQDYAYLVAPQNDGVGRFVCHIAYHTWEHYSSVRNVDGPHQGPPNVSPKQLPPDQLHNLAKEQKPTSVFDWQITMVERSIPHIIDRHTIIKTLEQCRGNVNNAVDKLLTADEEGRGSSGSAKSSSVERDIDSSDDYGSGPNKKQDRRISRASKSVRRHRAEHQRSQDLASKLESFGDSLESLAQATNADGHPKPRRRSWQPSDSDDEDDDDAIVPLKDGSTSESSEYSEYTRQPPTIKLNMKPSTPSKKTNNMQKRLSSARDIKQAKKREQKKAAKERKQAVANPKKPLIDVPSVNKSSSEPSMSSAIRTLYI